MKLTLNGIDIHYEIAGRGPVITFVHSLATDLSLWDALAAALAERFTVLRYDARGHGQTSAPEGPYSWPMLVDDLVGLLDALKIERTHFVGLSMGGMLGQAFALAHPERLGKLVLVSTTSRVPPEAKPLWDERIAIAREKGMQAHVAGTLERWFTAPYRAAHPEIMARIGAMVAATPVAGYAGWGAAITAFDLAGKLGAIQAPTLVVCGAEDTGTPPAANRAIAEAIPGARFELLPNASHQLVIERAEDFKRLLLDFLG